MNPFLHALTRLNKEMRVAASTPMAVSGIECIFDGANPFLWTAIVAGPEVRITASVTDQPLWSITVFHQRH